MRRRTCGEIAFIAWAATPADRPCPWKKTRGLPSDPYLIRQNVRRSPKFLTAPTKIVALIRCVEKLQRLKSQSSIKCKSCPDYRSCSSQSLYFTPSLSSLAIPALVNLLSPLTPFHTWPHPKLSLHWLLLPRATTAGAIPLLLGRNSYSSHPRVAAHSDDEGDPPSDLLEVVSCQRPQDLSCSLSLTILTPPHVYMSIRAHWDNRAESPEIVETELSGHRSCIDSTDTPYGSPV